jgi:hypothetical protein
VHLAAAVACQHQDTEDGSDTYLLVLGLVPASDLGVGLSNDGKLQG